MAVSLDSTLGAILIGCVASSIFYGITSLQAFFYFNNYLTSDRLIYRATVAVLWLLDTVHLAFVVYFLYHYTISQPGTTFVPEWSSAALIIMTNISDLWIRIIFLYRIWLLCEKKCLILVPLCLVVLSTAVLGVFHGIKMRTLSFIDISRISWALYAALSGDVLADLGIAIALCILLRKMRSGVPSTDNFLNILILYTINTGLLTSAIAVGTLVTYALMPNNYIFMGIFLVLNKSAFNSLLATLNARTHFRATRAAIQFSVKTSTMPSFGPATQETLVDDRSTTYSDTGVAV